MADKKPGHFWEKQDDSVKEPKKETEKPKPEVKEKPQKTKKQHILLLQN